MHKNAANVYEKFVDAFLVRHLHECCSRADAVRKGKEKWKKVKDVKAGAEDFIAGVDIWKGQQGRSAAISDWFVRPKRSQNEVASSASVDVVSSTAALEVQTPPVSSVFSVFHFSFSVYLYYLLNSVFCESHIVFLNNTSLFLSLILKDILLCKSAIYNQVKHI